jgi:hypothetical protein
MVLLHLLEAISGIGIYPKKTAAGKLRFPQRFPG